METVPMYHKAEENPAYESVCEICQHRITGDNFSILVDDMAEHYLQKHKPELEKIYTNALGAAMCKTISSIL